MGDRFQAIGFRGRVCDAFRMQLPEGNELDSYTSSPSAATLQKCIQHPTLWGITFPSTEATPVATQRKEEFPPRSTVRMDLQCGPPFR